MKRFCLAITLVIFVFVITGCSQSKMVGIPDGYIDKEEYYDKDGFQDYTDYAKYMYDSKDVIINNKELECQKIFLYVMERILSLENFLFY